MSTQDARTSAAEVLGQHVYSTLWYMCSCSGWEGDTITVDEFAAHQLDALKAAGYRVVLGDDVDRAAQVLDLYLAESYDGDLPIADVYERFTAADAAEADQ